MKIGNSVGPTGVPTSKDATTKPASAAGTAGAAAGTGDAVHLSALSSQMQSADAVLSSVPVVNRAQVDEIKQAISEGRFKVNPEVVADKVIDSVRELIRNKSA
jgi:negative regulator of flagellin synthesis FlgM